MSNKNYVRYSIRNIQTIERNDCGNKVISK